MIFDEDTKKKLEGKDSKLVEMVLEGLKSRYEAKKLSDRAKELEKEANTLLAPVLTALEVDNINAPGIGRLTILHDITSSTVNRKAMEQYLIEHGVSSSLLKKAREAATTPRAQDYQIRFRIDAREND